MAAFDTVCAPPLAETAEREQNSGYRAALKSFERAQPRAQLRARLRDDEGGTDLPAAHAPGIDVDEVRTRIVPYSAGTQRKRRVMERRQIAVRHAYINRAPIYVQAMYRDTLAVRVQHRVGFGRAIAGNHVVWRGGVEPVMQYGEKVEQAWIDRLDFVRAEIAQQVIDFLQCAGDVAAIFVVNRLEALASVQVVEAERAHPPVCYSEARPRGTRNRKRRGGRKAGPKKIASSVQT